MHAHMQDTEQETHRKHACRARRIESYISLYTFDQRMHELYVWSSPYFTTVGQVRSLYCGPFHWSGP